MTPVSLLVIQSRRRTVKNDDAAFVRPGPVTKRARSRRQLLFSLTGLVRFPIVPRAVAVGVVIDLAVQS